MGLPRGSFGFTQPDGPDPGMRLGKVTRVTGKGAFVEVASLAKGSEYGPCRHPADVDLAAGDTVLCTFLAGGHDELVVVVRLT
jgi:hypothetical protein